MVVATIRMPYTNIIGTKQDMSQRSGVTGRMFRGGAPVHANVSMNACLNGSLIRITQHSNPFKSTKAA